MQFDILTIFPDLIHHYAADSILGKAQRAGAVKIVAHNFRDYAPDKHHRVDDRPYGGGPGMILQVQPIFECLKSIKALSPKALKNVLPVKTGIQKRTLNSRLRGNDKTKIIILDPAGKKFDQRLAEKYSKLDRLVLIAGRYEGFDERVYKLADERVSVGEYVLAGGELPALTIVEAVARLIPGVLGNTASLKEETFSKIKVNKKKSLGISHLDLDISKEYPQYTRPEDFMGWKVPSVLMSGDHKKILEWRKKKQK